MSADIITFPDRRAASVPDDDDALCGKRYYEFVSAADCEDLAADLGTPDQWVESAFGYLKGQSSLGKDGKVEVSVAALHLILGHVEDLEQRLGLHGLGGAA